MTEFKCGDRVKWSKEREDFEGYIIFLDPAVKKALVMMPIGGARVVALDALKLINSKAEPRCCGVEAVLKVFSTFEYYYCEKCKNEVVEKPAQESENKMVGLNEMLAQSTDIQYLTTIPQRYYTYANIGVIPKVMKP